MQRTIGAAVWRLVFAGVVLWLAGRPGRAGESDTPFVQWKAAASDAKALPASVGRRLAADELAALAKDDPPTPFAELRAGLRGPDGTLWLAAQGGVIYRTSQGGPWRVFHSRRWLPSDDVSDLALAADGTLWMATADGVSRLVPHRWTLDEKMAAIGADLRRLHVREGLIGEIVLATPGSTEGGGTQPSSDNDGLWTSLYVAAEAFRYATTGDPDAKKYAWQSLEALMFLERVTGIPGFAARSIVPRSDDPQRYGGEWHPSADGRWWWKGDTSSDELDGHYFAYAICYDLLGDEAQRSEIASYVARITDHILDHGYYYVGPSGKPTTWGVWAPEKLNHDLEWIDDRGLNSLEMLSHLKVAEHVTGDSKYARAAAELIDRHAYALNTVEQKKIWPPRAVNHSDDELAFLAYYPLLWYERDPELRRIYLAGLRRSWEIERPERSPLFNFIYAAGLQAGQWTEPGRPSSALVEGNRYDLEESLEWFRDVPDDMIIWTVKNSHRRDIGPLATNRFEQRRAAVRVLPVSERRLMRWNGDPYELDGGGDGRVRDDGTFVLLPYWMGRWHRFID